MDNRQTKLPRNWLKI